MRTPRTSPRENRRRRGRLIVAVAGALAATMAWAPSAVATAPAPAPYRAVPADDAGSTAPRGERRMDAPSETLSPGDPIYSGGARCTLGFNVTDGTDVFLLTAGHCAATGSYWYADPQETVPIGPTVLSSFPGNDFALIRYDHPGLAAPGGHSAATPYVGEQVYTITPEAGIRSGVVTALNQTVNHGGGNVVYGLIRTTVCFDGRASGAPLLGDGRALGIAAGASGSCAVGGTSFFQPVTEALASAGLTLY